MFTWFKANKFKIIPFFVVVMLATAFVVFYLQSTSTTTVGKEKIEGAQHDAKTNAGSEKAIREVEGDNPFGHRGSISEVQIQNYIHWMSHQKVEAEEKWTHYSLTPERVEWLLTKVEAGDFQHKDIYLEILRKWQKGNFSSADIDHNRIWSLQGGTIGKATGVLTKEEEEQYLKKFRRKLK